MRQNRFRLALALAVACVVAIGLNAAAARAAGAPFGDPQLLDVSRQVAQIQKKMDRILAGGGFSRDGRLDLGAVCGQVDPAQVFLPWADQAFYALAPQGDLSASDLWTLNRKTSLVPGDDLFTGTQNTLLLSAGGEATTPAMCVDVSTPTIRFFARNTGSPNSTLSVEILYEGLSGYVGHLPIARVSATDGWNPSIVIPMYMNMLAAASPDGLTAVAFRFKAERLKNKDDGGWGIDSLYVDPFCSR